MKYNDIKMKLDALVPSRRFTQRDRDRERDRKRERERERLREKRLRKIKTHPHTLWQTRFSTLSACTRFTPRVLDSLYVRISLHSSHLALPHRLPVYARINRPLQLSVRLSRSSHRPNDIGVPSFSTTVHFHPSLIPVARKPSLFYPALASAQKQTEPQQRSKPYRTSRLMLRPIPSNEPTARHINPFSPFS